MPGEPIRVNASSQTPLTNTQVTPDKATVNAMVDHVVSQVKAKYWETFSNENYYRNAKSLIGVRIEDFMKTQPFKAKNFTDDANDDIFWKANAQMYSMWENK
ncbi:hypothetical protein COB21_02945 [Candidatus Aerophobetes bacterium]|uniref:Uncharacterized protein n=1 Tax=Aerophobetes bacterium TaxID=2030807 RepID=A0A2A4X5I5_UNCAE|nr:MAG: hypothetical protein COB21_02945 [Candidatus Aerophobetes bacterium]